MPQRCHWLQDAWPSADGAAVTRAMPLTSAAATRFSQLRRVLP
jgi:hypothetical protein